MSYHTYCSRDDESVMAGLSVRNTGPLLFFHVGKTGGVSLTRYFQSLARRSHVQSRPDEPPPFEQTDAPSALDFISGHYSVAPLLHRLPPFSRTMLVLRDPVRHVLSSYWHLRTHAQVNNPELQALIDAARCLDLPQFLAAMPGVRFEEHFDNPQTRFVLGRTSGRLLARDLADARALVRAVEFVGITERLDMFAAQVADALAWAVAWRGTALPRLNGNPLNRVDPGRIGRPLLRQILAATEFDAELHAEADALQAARPIPALPLAAEPLAQCPSIAIADMIRVGKVETSGVRLGRELRIDGDRLLLHPPPSGDGVAEVAIDPLVLDGHSGLASQLELAHPQSRPVRYSLTLRRGDETLVDGSFVVSAGQPCHVRLRFRPVAGPVRLRLTTQMAADETSQFAWAEFVGLTID